MLPVAADQTNGASGAVASDTSKTTGCSLYSVLYDNRLERILGLFGRLGSKRNNGLAYRANDFMRQGVTQRRGARQDVGALEHRRQRERLDPSDDKIRAG